MGRNEIRPPSLGGQTWLRRNLISSLTLVQTMLTQKQMGIKEPHQATQTALVRKQVSQFPVHVCQRLILTGVNIPSSGCQHSDTPIPYLTVQNISEYTAHSHSFSIYPKTKSPLEIQHYLVFAAPAPVCVPTETPARDLTKTGGRG